MRIVIIGAGHSGICLGARLAQRGIRSFTILEKAGRLGGTWRDNVYPGAACDSPAFAYCYSFEQKTDWSRKWAPQPEILAYQEHCAAKYSLLPHIQFGTELASARWSADDACWRLRTTGGGDLECEILISATGQLSRPRTPDIPGLADFRGDSFHSAAWDRSCAVRQRNVAIVGNAASAVQLVPEVAKVAKQLYVFQRSANWVLPKPDDPYTPEQLEAFRHDPTPLLAFRAEIESSMNKGMTFADPDQNALREIAGLAAIEVVEDPEVRAKLRPTHPFGCKRPLFANTYYPAFNRPNLELVTEGIERITEDAVLTVDGETRRVDTLILATGFAATKYLSAIDVVGRGGLKIDDAWNDGAQAYLGITTTGFPNLFMCYGPNTNNGSILTMIESQVEHILLHLERMRDDRVAWVDVKPDVMARYNDEVQEAIAGVNVWQADCHGYYRAPDGRIVTQWPFSMIEFDERARVLDPDAFEVAGR